MVNNIMGAMKTAGSSKASQSQRNRKSAVRLCLLGMSEATPIKSHQHGCLKKQNKDKNKIMKKNWISKK